MFYDKNGTWIEKTQKKVSMTCENCGISAENIVVGFFTSPHIGLVFLPKRMHAGSKEYHLCCPVCGYLNRQITKEELLTLK